MSGPLPAWAARGIDAALEATIVASFTRIGFGLRRTLYDWPEPDTRLDGRNAVVTGASSGLGAEIATNLVDRGATVIGVSRSAPADDRVVPARCDLGELPQVRNLAAHLGNRGEKIDLLIQCAGLLADEHSTTGEGVEKTLAVHLVGPYLLTRLLEPHLADDARVLWMSSGGMYSQGLHLDRLEMSAAAYRGATAYARAKRAQVSLAEALADEWAAGPMSATAHPGWADTPGVVSALPRFHRLLRPLLRTPRQGVDTMCWLASDAPTTPQGAFWFDRRPRRTVYVPGTGGGDSGSDLMDWLDARIDTIDPELRSPLK